MNLRLLLVLFCSVRQVTSAMLMAGDQEAPKKPKPTRVAWFNAPKTGSIFGNTVVHYANSSVSSREPGDLLRTHFGPWMKKWESSLKTVMWMPGENPHVKVSKEDFVAFRGDWVGMFRQPEQRTISTFLDKARGKGDVKTYAKRTEGAVVKQLAGQEDGEAFACWPGAETVEEEDTDFKHSLKRCATAGINDTHRTPQTPNLEKALWRLKHGFKFVGLTSHYNFAICLFHTMFGGDCLPGEIAVLRETKYSQSDLSSLNDTLPLQGYKDPYDGRLYQEAERMFWGLIMRYNVTDESCRRICPKAFGGDTMRTFAAGW